MNNTIQISQRKRFLVLEDQIYSIESSLLRNNNNIEDCYSFLNIMTQQYLRHCDGKLMESEMEQTEVFPYDASFRMHTLAEEYVWLSCSNPGMEKLSVFYERKSGAYLLREHRFTPFFLYRFAEIKTASLVLNRIAGAERRIFEALGKPYQGLW